MLLSTLLVVFVGLVMSSHVSVGQYNILARHLATPEHFPHARECCLDWHKRREVLLSNIHNLRDHEGNHVDILCMEELTDYWEFFKDSLAGSPMEMNSVYVKRPSVHRSSWSGVHKLDGCGIFYSSKKFQLVSQRAVNYQDEHDRVALMVFLQWKGEDRYLLVANTHLYWDIKKVDVQSAELAQFHTELGDFLKEFCASRSLQAQDIPVIVAGDFNNIPQSPIDEYMNQSFLSSTHQMKSAYAEYQPLVPTSVSYRTSKHIDYIYFSSEQFEVRHLQTLPEETELRSECGPDNWQSRVPDMIFDENKNYNALPNSQWGSDHIPIAATLSLK